MITLVWLWEGLGWGRVGERIGPILPLGTKFIGIGFWAKLILGTQLSFQDQKFWGLGPSLNFIWGGGKFPSLLFNWGGIKNPFFRQIKVWGRGRATTPLKRQGGWITRA